MCAEVQKGIKSCDTTTSAILNWTKRSLKKPSRWPYNDKDIVLNLYNFREICQEMASLHFIV